MKENKYLFTVLYTESGETLPILLHCSACNMTQMEEGKYQTSFNPKKIPKTNKGR